MLWDSPNIWTLYCCFFYLKTNDDFEPLRTEICSIVRPLFALQVLPDWRGQNLKSGKWGSAGKAAWAQRVRAFIDCKAGQAARAKRETLPSMALQRMANWHSLCGLDQTMRMSWSLGLRDFQPERPVGMLQAGEERKFVLTDSSRNAM